MNKNQINFFEKIKEFFKKYRAQILFIVIATLVDITVLIIYTSFFDKNGENTIYIFYVTILLVCIVLISLWIIKIKELPIILIILSYFLGIFLPSFLGTLVLTSWQSFTLKNYINNFIYISIIALFVHAICLCVEIKKTNETKTRIEILEKLKVASSIAIPLAAFLALSTASFLNIKNFDNLLKPALFTISLLGVYRGLIEWILYSQKKKMK